MRLVTKAELVMAFVIAFLIGLLLNAYSLNSRLQTEIELSEGVAVIIK